MEHTTTPEGIDLARAAQPAPVEQDVPLFSAEFLSKRLARVATLASVTMPSGDHDFIAGIAGTILGNIARALENAQPAPAVSEQAPTDLSHRLRETADQQPGWKSLLTAAADEIERYYGGMLAWKKTAEKKDADWNAERMARVNERCATRAAVSEQRDERALFEAWARRAGCEVDMFKGEGKVAYSASFTNVAWEAWQARATLAHGASSAPADATTVPIYQARNGRGVWTDVDSEYYNQFGGEPYERRIVYMTPWVASPTATPASAQPVDVNPLKSTSVDPQKRADAENNGAQPVAAAPADFVLMPKRLTAENGAKGALSGEFHEHHHIECPECLGDGDDSYGEDCPECEGMGKVQERVPVEWSTIKRIYAAAVDLLAAPAAPVAQAVEAQASLLAQDGQEDPFTPDELDDIETIARAAPKTWYGTLQIVDGISEDRAVELIEACSPDTVITLVQMARATYVAAVAPPVAADDAKDAARYRFLRDEDTLPTTIWEALDGYGSTDEDGNLDRAGHRAGFDQAIDAAISTQQGQGGSDANCGREAGAESALKTAETRMDTGSGASARVGTEHDHSEGGHHD